MRNADILAELKAILQIEPNANTDFVRHCIRRYQADPKTIALARLVIKTLERDDSLAGYVNIHDAPQYIVTTTENGIKLNVQQINDPFIVSTIKLRFSFKGLWTFLTKGFVFVVHVQGTPEAHRVVFDGNYAPSKANQTSEEKANVSQ